MRRVTLLTAIALMLTLSFVAPVAADEAATDIPQYLQDISVTIRCGRASGSGVLKVTKDGQVWVWTCGHLIVHNRNEREVSTDSGKKTVVEFEDAQVVKFKTVGGRKVSEFIMDAEIIRYSHAEYGEDLALLRLRDTDFKPKASAKFWLDKKIPTIGSKLWHCGSMYGDIGSNSVTDGIISQHGRVLFGDKVFDQTTVTAYPGSSGGIVATHDKGLYVGMLVRGAGPGFNFIVPVRRMQKWAKKVGVEFAMDDKLPIPTDEELKKYPIDDANVRVVVTKPEGDKHHGKDALKFFLETKQPPVLSRKELLKELFKGLE